MSTFITPYSGSAELTAGNGLNIDDQGRWKYSQAGYNDGATFGLSLTWPDHLANGEYSYGTPSAATKPVSGGELHLSATNWTIAVIGNELTEYTDPNTSITYTPAQCRILITGEWQVIRERNSNSWNSIGVTYDGLTETDLGSRPMNPWLLNYTSPVSSYVIQGSEVTGGAQDTFSDHKFECRVLEIVQGHNSNREFQSNTITRPVFVYSYSKSWQTS